MSGTAGWRRKVDHRLLALVEAPASDPGQRVTVFVRTSAASDRLAALGLFVGTRAGEVSTGSLALADVPRVAAAEEVAYVELTRVIPIDRASGAA